ncbi:hypothetical protein GCM10010411_41840 [Actinomadura fulvescens]|uniref:Uncharacterized protein n=1 Tax=Actinomadura fulvescens TaxID=46160 RepID=A0ABN3PUQ1_9ACTN
MHPNELRRIHSAITLVSAKPWLPCSPPLSTAFDIEQERRSNGEEDEPYKECHAQQPDLFVV